MAFAADPPTLFATEPALSFVRPARGCFPAGPGQDDSSHPAGDRRVFVLGGRKSAVAGREVRRTIEDGDDGDPARASTASCRPAAARCTSYPVMILMLRFLDRHELPEFGRLRDFAFPNGFGVWLKDADHFVRDVDIAPEQPRARLMKNARARAARIACSRRCGSGCRSVATAAMRFGRRWPIRRIIVRGVPDDRARGRHQPAVAGDQRVAGFRRPRLAADHEDTPSDAPQTVRTRASAASPSAASCASAPARRPATTSCRSGSAHWFLRPSYRCESGGRASPPPASPRPRRAGAIAR